MKFFGKVKSYIKDKIHTPQREQLYIAKSNADMVFKNTWREPVPTEFSLAIYGLPFIDESGTKIIIKMYRFWYYTIAIIIFLSLSIPIWIIMLTILVSITNGVKDLWAFLTSMISLLFLISPSIYFITKKNSSIVIDLVKWEWIKYGKSFPLSHIHGLQILSKWVSGYHNSGTCYQLNLVLYDSSRMNISSGRDLEYTIKTAEILAEKLWIKILEELQ